MAAELLGTEFTKAYEEFFGRAIDDLAIEAVSWSVKVASVVDAPPSISLTTTGEPVDAAASRTMYDPIAAVDAPAAVIDRSALAPGHQLRGPAVIVEAQTTTVLASHHAATMQEDGTVLVHRIAQGGGS